MKYLPNIICSKSNLSRTTGIAKLLAVASLALLPAAVFAQEVPGGVCNADLNAGAVGGPLFYINEPVTINLDLGAGIVLDGEGTAGWLDIYRFSYQMDCSDGDTWPDCTPAGNTVVFVEDSVTTNCTAITGTGGDAITFDTDWNEITQEVIFEVTDPDTIRNMSEETCNVSFEIMVTEVADDNSQREVIELTGFGNILGEENDAICSNTLTAGQGASVSFDLSSLSTRFTVTKEFSDQNTDPVQVNISCNDGFVSQPSFMITKDSQVTFVVKDYIVGSMDCDVWESEVDDYTPVYTPGLDGGVADVSADETGCHFDNIENGDFTCHVTNYADAARFTVYKMWDLSGSVGDAVDQSVDITISCGPGTITSVDGLVGDYGNEVTRQLLGDGSIEVTVDTASGPALCSATEADLASGVESEDDCSARLISAGESSECTFYNAVYFEGIPTLSQYGLALMALLMLGVGMVGFRRFA